MSLLTKAGITKLSQLIIDTAKNWNAKRIENIGAPTDDGHVPRRDTIDSKVAAIPTVDIELLINESPDYGGHIFALAEDDTHVYAAGSTTQTVRKYLLLKVLIWR
ncbi:hypothetical protein ES703_58470 [subsurface metagenome]